MDVARGAHEVGKSSGSISFANLQLICLGISPSKERICQAEEMLWPGKSEAREKARRRKRVKAGQAQADGEEVGGTLRSEKETSESPFGPL